MQNVPKIKTPENFITRARTPLNFFFHTVWGLLHIYLKPSKSGREYERETIEGLANAEVKKKTPKLDIPTMAFQLLQRELPVTKITHKTQSTHQFNPTNIFLRLLELNVMKVQFLCY